MISIAQAAQSLGVSAELVGEHIRQGRLQAHRDDDGQWHVSRDSLGRVAQDTGVQLDLRSVGEPVVVPGQSELLAAQAAVLLAKTQASAARFQSQAFFQRMRDATEAAEADRQARELADQALIRAERCLEELRRDQAVAEAKIRELRKRLANDERHFQFMVDRITFLERERQRLSRCLGWLGRFRYRRLVENPSPTQMPAEVPEPSLPVEMDDRPVGAEPRYPRPQPSSRREEVEINADLNTVATLNPVAELSTGALATVHNLDGLT